MFLLTLFGKERIASKRNLRALAICLVHLKPFHQFQGWACELALALLIRKVLCYEKQLKMEKLVYEGWKKCIRHRTPRVSVSGSKSARWWAFCYDWRSSPFLWKNNVERECVLNHNLTPATFYIFYPPFVHSCFQKFCILSDKSILFWKKIITSHNLHNVIYIHMQ